MLNIRGTKSFPRTKTEMKKNPIMGKVLSALNFETIDILDQNALTF